MFPLVYMAVQIFVLLLSSHGSVTMLAMLYRICHNIGTPNCIEEFCLLGYNTM
jgi:hypothetical protein